MIVISLDPDHAPGPYINNFELADLLLPEHLQLRLEKTRGWQLALANWPAYKFGVELLLRSLGLMHAIDPDKGSRGWSPEQWRNVDELCKTIIALNVKDFAPLFGREMQKASAAQMWKWLEVLDRDGIMAEHMHMWNAHTSRIRLEEVEDKQARAGSGWGAFVDKTVTVVCVVALLYALFYAPQLQQRC